MGTVCTAASGAVRMNGTKKKPSHSETQETLFLETENGLKTEERFVLPTSKSRRRNILQMYLKTQTTLSKFYLNFTLLRDFLSSIPAHNIMCSTKYAPVSH